MIPDKTDVLIVGAGPTGLMLANQLSRRGIDFVLVDRHNGPSRETRALGVQARTLEIYSHLGIVKEAIALGKPATGANLWVKGRRAANVPLVRGSDLSPYSYLLVLGQDDNERLLGDLLKKNGVEIHWNSELIQLTQNQDSVTVSLKLQDESTRELQAKWVAGCDGAHSAVRNLNKIDFPGAPYQHVFYVADAVVKGNMIPSQLNVYLFREGFHLLFPMRGEDHWRVVGILPPALREKEDVAFQDIAPTITRESGVDLNFQECRWFSKYRIHHRHAEKFRDRRCFLLGDAAHIHSPVGAQGMNTGLQDAYNLGWKLAMVVKGEAKEELLNSYQAERLPVAQSLLNGTDRAFTVIVSDTVLAAFLRTRVMAKIASFVMQFVPIQVAAFRTISQIGIQYRASEISQTLNDFPKEAPRAGDRFPWVHLKFSGGAGKEDFFDRIDDTRFNLISIGQQVPSGIPQDVKVHEVLTDSENDKELARARIPDPSFFLLRPDCYIALAGTKLDPNKLSGYFSERIHRS